MPVSTIANTIAVAKVSCYLASAVIEKSKFFNRPLPFDSRLPKMLTCERQIIEKIYDQDPVYPNLQVAADYVYDLCAPFQATAQAIIDGGGGSSGGGSTPVQGYPIYITQDNFTSATFYPNTNILGTSVVIFWNEANRYLFVGVDFTVDATGITITATGFDATASDCNLIIEKVYT